MLSGCFPFAGCDFQNDTSDADRVISPAFGNIREGATWKYEIQWIRNGSCTGDRIRSIEILKVVPTNDADLIVYKWSDIEKAPDSTLDSYVNCDTVDTASRYDSVSVGADSAYAVPDTVSDAKSFHDLRQMSFFQIKKIPEDTVAISLCGTLEAHLAGSVNDGGRERRAIIDTSACLSGPGGVASYSRYVQDMGLLKKRWGYSDEGVLIDYTSVTLLEFNGRAIAIE